MKIAIILGTRPEIIKMSPIIRELEERKINYFTLSPYTQVNTTHTIWIEYSSSN